MKEHYRDGVKYDSDPSNDYSDGYDAAKRHYIKIRPNRVNWFTLGFVIGAVVEFTIFTIF